MRKSILTIIAAIATVLAARSCSDVFSSSIELGVNDTRINIPWSQSQSDLEFVIPVYSTGSWKCRIAAGGEWLTLDRSGGSGRGYIHCNAVANLTDIPRVVCVEIYNDNLRIPVYVVSSCSTYAASDLDDADLDNYLI